ncbi:UDP-N-acetylglucosamine 2-epimerase [bioreactor metagenome]|uniref:UDP-N-acetylglucosamine 2-epimerase (non-hydrolyzing) n=1 Tax=bioreactor metagenome TaxID=1076179 RepID=A0A645C884_9ZZZZ
MTAHRRENLGEPLQNICRAVKQLTEEFEDICVIYPVHLNPAVREPVFEILKDTDRVLLIDPLDVEDMHNLMAKSYLVMTDSGGLQEEVPYFGIPVLVLRTETERPEAVEAGTVRVCGVAQQKVYENARVLLNGKDEYDKLANAVNPYGDGKASLRIMNAITKYFDDKR